MARDYDAATARRSRKRQRPSFPPPVDLPRLLPSLPGPATLPRTTSQDSYKSTTNETKLSTTTTTTTVTPIHRTMTRRTPRRRRNNRGGLRSFVSVLLLSHHFAGTRACQICTDPSQLNRTTPLTPIPGYEFLETCGTIQDLLPILVAPGDAICTELQTALGGVCGCPQELAEGQGPCSLCGDAALTNPGASVGLEPTQVQPVAPGLAAFAEFLAPTCQLLESYLSSMPSNSDQCTSLLSDDGALAEARCTCCGGCDGEEPVTEPAPDAELCQVCRNPGDVFGEPDRDVTGILDELGLTILFPTASSGGVNGNITCNDVYDTLSNLEATHAVCAADLRQVFWGYCDCPPKQNSDGSLQTTCSQTLSSCNPETEPNFSSDLELTFLAETINYAGLGDRGFPFAHPTCQELVWLAHGYPSKSANCYLVTQFAYVCGCGVRPYFGTTTASQQAWLAWLPRISGFLSLVGSAGILYDLLAIQRHTTRPTARQSVRRSTLRGTEPGLTVLQQIVLGMSVFDVLSSLAFVCSSLPIPKHETYELGDGQASIEGPPTGVYGAAGNEASCRAQGFFVQLGYASAFYNLSLSVYYYLVIRHGIRERYLRNYRWAFVLPPLVVGIALALAGIPFYESLFLWCSVPPSIGYDALGGDEFNIDALDYAVQVGLEIFLPTETNAYTTVFSIVPIAVVFSVGVLSLLLVYGHVLKQDLAAQRWRAHRNRRLSRPVLWQFVWYTLGFLVTWPVYYAGNFWAAELYENYAFWLALALLFPLQGVWNAVVYFRPRLGDWYARRRDSRRASRSATHPNSAAALHPAAGKSRRWSRWRPGNGRTPPEPRPQPPEPPKPPSPPLPNGNWSEETATTVEATADATHKPVASSTEMDGLGDGNDTIHDDKKDSVPPETPGSTEPTEIPPRQEAFLRPSENYETHGHLRSLFARSETDDECPERDADPETDPATKPSKKPTSETSSKKKTKKKKKKRKDNKGNSSEASGIDDLATGTHAESTIAESTREPTVESIEE